MRCRTNIGNQMDYHKHYRSLISSRQIFDRSKSNGTYERHHIKPKCFGGNNDKNNLILLTPREHFIAHLLLTRMYNGKMKAKMCLAFFRMCTSNFKLKRKITNRQYGLAKELLSEAYKGANNPFFGRTPFNKGKKLSQVTKEKLRMANLGKISPMRGKKFPDRKSWNAGTKLTEEQKINLRIKNSKVIIEFDINGNKLNEYYGLKEASRNTGIHVTTIYNCCNNKHCQSKGKTFRFKGDPFDYVVYVKHSRKIIRRDKFNNIECYDNIKEASKNNGISKSAIYAYLNGRNVNGSNFAWEYKI